LNRIVNQLDLRIIRASIACALALTASSAGAQLLATTARQDSDGSLKLLTYYQGVQDQTVNFTANDSGSCTTPNGVSFTCGQSGTVAAKGDGGAAMLKLVWQPWERFQYYATYGIGSYSLSVPSSTVANVLTGDTVGQIFGAGLKASVVPDTIVTPAVSIDASLTESLYTFNRRFPGAVPGGADNDIDQRLTLTTYQISVETSHLFALDEQWKLEPYSGVKWMRVQADLKDLGDGSHAGGQTDTVTPFVGLRVPVDGHQAFFAEASFLDGYHYGGGLELRFK
jgi:hypothetical protein